MDRTGPRQRPTARLRADPSLPGYPEPMTSHRPRPRPRRLTLLLAVASVLVAQLAIAGPVRGAFEPENIRLVLHHVAGGLSDPVLVTHAGDGSGRLFIVEQTGRVRVVTAAGTLLATPLIDLTASVSEGGEQGLLGLAFHPQHETNGRFYVNFTRTDGDTVINEYRVGTNPNRVLAGSGRRIMTIAQPYDNHNGGHIAFGPDGYLYIGMGDGGSGGDPGNRAQSLSSLLGKMLRIDINGTTSTRAYRIPLDEPVRRTDGPRRDLVARPAQPVAVVDRPGLRGVVHRRRRPGDLRGDRSLDPGQLGGRRAWRQLRLAGHGRPGLPSTVVRMLDRRQGPPGHRLPPSERAMFRHGRLRLSRDEEPAPLARLPVRRLLLGRDLGLRRLGRDPAVVGGQAPRYVDAHQLVR